MIKIYKGGDLIADGSVSEHNVAETAHEDIRSILNEKVDKVDGKGLSTEDYTTEEKAKVANLPLDTNAQLAEKANKVQNEWITLTLINGATVAGNPLQIMKDEFGFVHFRGRMLRGSASLSAIIPVGFRPPSPLKHYFLGAQEHNTAGIRLGVDFTGGLLCYTAPTSYVDLSVISYKI